MNSSNSRPPIRVLSVIQGLSVGGAEKLLLDQAETGPSVGVDMQVAHVSPDHDELTSAFEASSVAVTCLGRPDDRFQQWLGRLVSLVRRERPEIVHLHSPAAAGLARPLLRARRRRPKIVYTEHSCWDVYPRTTDLLNRSTFLLNDRTIAVSGHALASISPAFRRRIEVLHHGTDLDHLRAGKTARAETRAELGIADDEILVGTIANFRPEKNYPNLFAAADEATRRSPKLRFIAVGDGDQGDELKRLHSDMGLADRLQLLGYRTDIPELLGAMDIFTLSSTYEGLPVAVMEAMAMGIPLVSTDVGGIPEAVRDGVEGWLVAPKDHRALAGALVEAAERTDLRAERGAAALARSAMFDRGATTSALAAIYRDVLNRP